jgi:hypothetical protein
LVKGYFKNKKRIIDAILLANLMHQAGIGLHHIGQ